MFCAICFQFLKQYCSYIFFLEKSKFFFNLTPLSEEQMKKHRNSSFFLIKRNVFYEILEQYRNIFKWETISYSPYPVKNIVFRGHVSSSVDDFKRKWKCFKNRGYLRGCINAHNHFWYIRKYISVQYFIVGFSNSYRAAIQ